MSDDDKSAQEKAKDTKPKPDGKEPIAEPKVTAPIPAEAAGEEVVDDDEAQQESSEAAKDEPKAETFKTHVSEGTQKVADISKKAAEVTGEVLSTSYEKVKDYDPKTSIHILDRFLDWVRKICPPAMFDKISGWSSKYGHAGIVVAQILTLLFFTIRAFKSGWGFIFHGIGIALLLVILQYTAEKFLNAGKRFIISTPSKLSSPAFLDCTALLLEIGGLLIFLSMATTGWINALLGLAIWCLLEAIALTAVHPDLVNVTIDENVRAGEEAIGILSFFAKSILKIVPIAYGVGAIFGAVALFMAIFSLFSGDMGSAGENAIALIVVFACLPLLSYVVFMLYHLLIDILQSILSLPGKLDDRK